MDDLRDMNGVVFEDSLLLSPSPSPTSLPRDPFTVGPEPWAAAERSTGEIIAQVQATVASDERRNKVIDYVQRLLRSCTGCEVFPYGSVPLKTYLPDGDIDLTIFGGVNVEEALANNVCSVLEAEDLNSSAECIVKDVQYIRAEVKIVKCLVQNIVVDISFNQLGGLCTLCFLEKVDRLIGKDHLFKRSIILIKAWCYYESRILGAHHGLISTYALETLVLYIFHLFHSSLDGPLAVLYKFLEYFSKFDWENFCVSLCGPVPLSSSTENAVDRPGFSESDLLLSDEFLKDCVDKFSVPLRGTEATSRIFMQKHLNIVDPLKENNNLGRSVSKGNFFRIRSAFSYGARKLGQILLKPKESIAEEVSKFFANTLDRHGKGLRPDVYDPPVPASLSGPSSVVLQMPPFSGTGLSVEDRQFCEAGYQLDQGKTRVQHSELIEAHISESGNATNDSCASNNHLSGGIVNCVISSGVDIELANRLRSSSLSSVSECRSVSDNAPYCPYRPSEYGKMESGYRDNNLESGLGLALNSGGVSWEQEQDLKINHSPPTFSASASSDDSQCSSSISGCCDGPTGKTPSPCSKYKRPLSDLCGDLDNHLDSLQCGRWWFDHAMSVNTPLVPHIQPHVQFIPGKNPWESMQYPVQYGRNMFAQISANNGVISRPPYLPISPLIVPGAAFGMEELPRTRGTGTYFPITNSQSYRNRSYQAKGRGMGPSKSPRNNGRVAPFSDRIPHAKNSRDPAHSIQQPSASSPKGKAQCDANGFTEATVNGMEFGPHGQLLHPEGKIPLESTGPLPCSGTDPATERIPVVNGDRLVGQPYRLLEEDFPPLSSS